MARFLLIVLSTTMLACGDRDAPVATPTVFTAQRDAKLAATTEDLATGVTGPFNTVLPVGGKRLLLASAAGELSYFDGELPRTLATGVAVSGNTKLPDGALLLLETDGALQVFANATLSISPLRAALPARPEVLAAGAGTVYVTSAHSLFSWRDGVLTELRGVADDTVALAVGRDEQLFAASLTTLHSIDPATVVSTVLATYEHIVAIATDSRAGVFVAHDTTVDLIDGDATPSTYVFPDDVSALLSHRLVPGVWARTVSGDIWYVGRGEEPKLATSAAHDAHLDGLGRLLVSDGVKVKRLQRGAALDAVVVDDAATHAVVDGPASVEIGVDDVERVIDITATTGGKSLLIRKDPWRVITSPWVVEPGADVEITVRASDVTVVRSFALTTRAASAPTWHDTVSTIAGAACTACHHAGAATKSLDVPDTWAQDIDDILSRVTSGTMPPRPQAPLADEDVARLQGWSLTGHAP